MENKTLVTDLYELTMAETYFLDGRKDEIMYFDIFFRKNPFEGGYTISGGLEEIISYIENFHFTEEDIDFLRSTNKFGEEFLNYLKNITFKGDIYAVPNGTLVFPGEPIITVRSDAITAQLIETAILACFNHASLVVTVAKRITKEARGIPVMEFGARRARGIDSSIEASKYAFIGGCMGTSNVYAAKEFHIPALGTMAHSLVTAAEDEYEAFLSYAKANPDNCVFLVDTYDTLRSGIPNAIRVADDYLKPNGYPFKGIRIDSGDLAYLSKEARKMLDQAGYKDTAICLSNGLDEYTVRDLLEQGACVNSFGIGDNIAASKEIIGGVYKLVAVEENNIPVPRIKVSDNQTKTTNPGYKRVYRFYDNETGYALGDVVALAEEEINKEEYTLVHPTETWKKTKITNYQVRELQVPIFKEGKLIYQYPTLEEQQSYCEKEYNSFYPEVTRLKMPHIYYVDLSDKLRELKNEMIHNHTHKKNKYPFNPQKEVEKIIEFIRNYFDSSHLKGVVIGISGGKDSAVSAALFSKALGPENVIGVTMPCHSNEEDKNDAKLVADKYGFKLINMDLTKTFDSLEEEARKLEDFVDSDDSSINLKPRLRMSTLYYIAQMYSKKNNGIYIVAGNGNKCEEYVGYFTKGGDSVSDIKVLSDLTVSEVIRIGEILEVPEKVLYKKPSDGLSGKTDEEKLGVLYRDIERVIEKEDIDTDIKERIDKMHKNTSHKFHIATYLKNEE